MAKYKRKSFSPHIYQDWIHLFRQCSQEQRAELLLAITDYPNYEPSADVPIWDFIKSQLEAQYQSMENKSQQMSTNRTKEKQKSTEVDRSQLLSTEVNKSTQIEIETRIETGTETKEKELSSDNSKKKVCEETVFNAGFQNWKFEPAILKVAKKHWTADTIRKIETDFSCQEYNTYTSVQELLERYPADVSKGFKKPTLDEVKAYCRERMNMVDAEKWYDYYASNGWKVGKNPMKDWKAAVRTWEKSGYNNQSKPNMPRMSLKEMKELQNEIEVQKILRGER